MTVLFDRFFDDAAIFPPGNAPLDEAIRAHGALGTSALGRHVGPFVCSVAALPALGDAMDAADVDTIDLSLVTPAGQAQAAIAAAHDHPRVRLRAVEVSGTQAGGTVPAVPDGTQLFVERSLRPPFELPSGVALKLRTGGETADAFPDDARLATALAEVVRDELRFKLTAGLHHAVRHTGADTGFEHHGFLNVVLAVHAALHGSDDAVHAILGERDAAVVATSVMGLDERDRGLVRSRFLSFGTCSVTDPLDDLRELGLLEDAA